MAAVKECIIKEINDEKILLNSYNLLHSMHDVNSYIQANDAQKNAVAEARAEYKKGNFTSTDDLFNEC